jgi:hypothetical protein
VFAILLTALAHNVKKKDAALGRISHIIESSAKKPEGVETRYLLTVGRHVGPPYLSLLI